MRFKINFKSLKVFLLYFIKKNYNFKKKFINSGI